MEWCRLYGEMLDDPKVGTLDDAQFRTWVELLMVATKADANGNTKLTEESLNWALRRNASVTLRELLQRELVTLDENSQIVINAWGDRQKKGDSSAARVAKFREKQRLSTTNDAVTLQERDGSALDKSREDKSREEPKTKTQRAPRFDAQAHLESLGVEVNVASDWLKLRKTKRLAPTETAFSGVLKEAQKAGLTMNDALTLCCSRGWGGFDASWLASKGGAQGRPVATNRNSRHSGFDQIDYSEGINHDGSF